MGDRATWDEATPAQVDAMIRLVGESLDGGALGLSSSLGEGHLDGDHRPVPSSSASFPEIVALAGALRGHEGTTLEVHPDHRPHPRGPDGADGRHVGGRRPAAQLEPAGQSGQRGGLGSSNCGRPTWPRRRGAHVRALALPDMMRMRSNTLLAGLPGWRDVMAQGAAPARRYRRPGHPGCPSGRRRKGGRSGGRGAERFSMMEVADPTSEWVGRSLGDIAWTRGTDVIDVLIDVVLPDDLALNLVLPSLTPKPGPDR